MPAPLGRLEYLYVGSGDFDRDVAYYRDVLGGEVVWNLRGFGARVAAFRLLDGPLLLVADHRRAGSCLPVIAVPDLDASERELRARGWRPHGDRFEIPDGPCFVFSDPSGNEYAIYEPTRPRALEAEGAGA